MFVGAEQYAQFKDRLAQGEKPVLDVELCS